MSETKQKHNLSLAEAAKLAGYSAEHMRRLVISGKIQGEMVGKSWLTTRDAVVKFIKERDPNTPLALASEEVGVSSLSFLQKAVVSVVLIAVLVPAAARFIGLPDKIRSFGINIIKEAFTEIEKPLSSDDGSVLGTNSDSGKAQMITQITKQINNYTVQASLTEIELVDLISKSEQLKELLKGEKGDKGETGPAMSYIPNSGSVFGVTAPAASNPGTIGSATYLSSKELQTEKLTVSGTFSTLGATTLDDLSVSGDLTVAGTTTLNGLVITNDLFTSTSQSTFTKVPTLAHVFAPAWPAGTSNASDGTIYINPASSIADGNLISAAVGGSIQFVVDAEGDVYANNLILAGSTTTGATTISGNLTVQDSTILGDAGTDNVTFNAKVNSLLSFTGTDHAGLRLNNLTTVQRDLLTPTAGMTLFNTTDSKMQVYNGSAWKNVGNPEIGAEVTLGTSGSVLFVDASGNLGQDNTNFNFNDATDTLTITGGYGASGVTISASGEISADGAITANGNLTLTKADPSIILNAATAGDTDFWLSVTEDAGADDDDLFQIGDGTTPGTNPFLTINTSGNVGIGTSNPNLYNYGGQLLTVASASTWANLIIAAFDNANSGISFGNQSIRRAQIDGVNGSALTFSVNSTDSGIGVTERMRITSAGFTGLGDTSPDYLLELHEATTTPIFALSDDDVVHGLTTLAETDVFSHMSSLSTTDGGTQWTSISDTDAQALSIRGIIGSTNPVDTTPAIKFVGAKSNGTTGMADLGTYETVFQIANNDDAAAFTVLGGGIVGIGTTEPTLKGLNVGDGSSATQYVVAIKSTTNSWSGFRLADGSAEKWFLGFDASLADGNLQFRAGGATNVMTLKSTGNLGIGTTNPSSKLDVTTAGLAATQITSSGLALVNTTAATALAPIQISPAIRWSGFGWKTDAVAASQAVDFRSYVVPVQGTANPTGYLAFESSINGGAYSSTPPLVITSGGNVGIGTTGPDGKLHVMTASAGTVTANVLAADLTVETNDNGGISILNPAGYVGAIYFGDADVNNAGSIKYLHATDRMTFQTNATEQMTILSSGNVGIGTTSPLSLLQLRATTPDLRLHGQKTTTDGLISSVSFSNTVDIAGGYIVASIGANRTGEDNSGALVFSTASAASTPTERMRIDKSGNVGIGTTAVNWKFLVQDTGVTDLGLPQLMVGSAGGTSNYSLIGFGWTNGGSATKAPVSIGYVPTVATGSTYGDIIFNTRAVSTDTSPTTKMTITSGGNVGIGTTGPESTLHVYNGSAGTVTAHPDVAEFVIEGSDATSVGMNILTPNGASGGIYFGSASNNREAEFTWDDDVATNGVFSMVSRQTSSKIQVVAVSGGVELTAGATSWSAISDERLKNIVGPIENGLDKLSGLRTVYYTLKSDGMNLVHPGLIAQEVQSVLPEAVSTDAYGYLSLRYTELIPPIIKAIQELDGKTSATYAAANVSAGDVVRFSNQESGITNQEVEKAGIGDNAIGVIGGIRNQESGIKARVLFSGKTSVKVTEENGPIQKGDRLTLSQTLPGYAMKMTTSGNSIGTALESFSDSEGVITAFIDFGYQRISVQTAGDNGQLIVEEDYDFNNFSLLNVKSIASISGSWSISEEGNMVARTVKVEKGIIIKDQDTGSYYCVTIRSGEIVKTQGDTCEQNQESQPSSSDSGGQAGITNQEPASGDPSPVVQDDTAGTVAGESTTQESQPSSSDSGGQAGTTNQESGTTSVEPVSEQPAEATEPAAEPAPAEEPVVESAPAPEPAPIPASSETPSTP